MDSVVLAMKMSYRDVAAEGERFTLMPSPSSINRRVIGYGVRLEQFNRDNAEDREAGCLQADGTNAHCQEADQAYIRMKVTTADDGEGASELLDIIDDDSWEVTAQDLNAVDAVADNATIFSDTHKNPLNIPLEHSPNQFSIDRAFPWYMADSAPFGSSASSMNR